jgi:hypothetical protein
MNCTLDCRSPTERGAHIPRLSKDRSRKTAEQFGDHWWSDFVPVTIIGGAVP